MRLDTTVSVMGVVNLAVILIIAYGGWKAFQGRVDIVLANQKELMQKLQERFEAHESSDARLFQHIQERITDLVGGLQRLVGETGYFRMQTRGDQK